MLYSPEIIDRIVMKIIRTFSLILVILLFANANSFSLASLLTDKDIDTSNETIVGKPELSKENFMKLVKEVVVYIKTSEFKDMIIEVIKEAAKDPVTFDAELVKAEQKSIEAKMLELAKSYGINSIEEMD